MIAAADTAAGTAAAAGRRSWRALGTLGTVVLVLVACGSVASERPAALSAHPAELQLEVSNQTTLEITLVVNGSAVALFEPGTAGGLTERQLPPMPWQVEARAPSGRVLISLSVRPGDVDVTGNRMRGVGDRVDLSCGRLDVWSGPPLLGPVPEPGVPGDCDP